MPVHSGPRTESRICAETCPGSRRQHRDRRRPRTGHRGARERRRGGCDFSPLSIGDYCHANVNSAAWIGFYEGSGLRCYGSGPGAGGPQFVGSGSPYLACKYLTPDVS
jgi:hypothetical protein